MDQNNGWHDTQSADRNEGSMFNADDEDRQSRDLDELTALFAYTKEIAERFAANLADTATSVRDGAPLLVDLAQNQAEYESRRSLLLDAVAGHVKVTDDCSFADIENVLAQLRAAVAEERRKRAEDERRRSELAEIEKSIEELQRRRAGLLSEPETESADTSTEEVAPVESVVDEIDTADTADTADDGVPADIPPVPVEVTSAADSPSPDDQMTDDLEHGFPWEQGEPPPAVELVRDGRLAEAYWVTVMSGEPDRRAAILRFAASAYATRDTTEATTVQSALDIDGQALHSDAEATVVAATATIRAGLVAGWAHPLLSQLCSELTLPEPWEELITAGVAATRAGYRLDQRVGLTAPDDDGHSIRIQLGRRARELVDDLPRRKNTYERATRVLRRMSMKGQPLHTALSAVINWSAGTDDGHALAAVAVELGRPGMAEEIIEAADAAERTPKQAKVPIVSTALRGLLRAVDDVLTLVHEAEVMSRRLASGSEHAAVVQQLRQAVTRVADAPLPPGMVGAALELLRRWLTTPAVLGAWSQSLAGDEPSVDVLLPLADLPRDTDGRPRREDPQVLRELVRLTAPLDLAEAVRTYCARGDLRRAVRTVALAEQDAWPVDVDPSQLRNTLSAAQRRWEQAHRRDLAGAQDMFARIRGQNLLDHNVVSDAERRLAALSQVSDGAYDLVMKGIAELVSDLEQIRRGHIEELRRNLDSQQIDDEADRARIAALLDDGDAVTAAEFLSFVRAGKSLPVQASPVAQDLSTFVELLSRGEREGLTRTPYVSRPWAELAAGGEELVELAAVGINAWDDLAEHPNRHTGDRMAVTVRDVLGTLGLLCTSRPRELNRGTRGGFRQFRVQAKPTDLSYVSALGSSARDFIVTVVSDERRGRSVLDVLGHSDVGRANILFYRHPLDLAARRALAAESARGAVQALVIDPVVLGWVAANRPGSWRGTQRVTLPWTAMNPYTPFVAGLVPPEVFVGREKEMADVTEPTGGLFLYGGRQLGKSALLRRVEATFADEYRNAVYLDLKGRGIGEAEPAERIWRELALELAERGVLTLKGAKDASADVVVDEVRTWLNANPTRRLLLLADEADAFLNADSRALPRPGGVGHFPNVLRLKELMESTGRRFKVVFAGLHQVQRFGRLSNVPLAHGGPDILVGPLDPPDARKLVEEPMAALGYVFEQPELVWRLLAATNYQAVLIQIFCDELVTTLHKRVAHAETFPLPVSEEDLERVAASDRVRNRIAERLRITINLDDRYRVLTLVIALLSLTDSFGTDYDAKELLEQARVHWPEGFADLTVSQVGIFLDEMVGLGLLVKLPGESRYAVRSPNVVNMLGTKALLERELTDRDFALPYEYNPREARRLLYVDKDGRQWRSPLTEGQLAGLVSEGAPSVVIGTEALGVSRMPDAVRQYAETRGVRMELCTSLPEISTAVTSASRRTKRTVVLADLRGRGNTEIKEAVRRVAGKPKVTVVLLVDPVVADEFATEQEPIRPERWTESAIRSWPECPFESAKSRSDLIHATGGWPELVESAISYVGGGATQEQALRRVMQVSSDKEQAARMVADAGLTADLVDQLKPWVDFMQPEDPVSFSPADLSDILGLDVPATNAVLARLSVLGVLDEHADSMTLDIVLYRCLTRLRDDS